MSNEISIKTPQEIEIMAKGGKILAKILDELKKEVRVGIPTLELENKAKELMKNYGVKPAFLGYEGYPAALCTSVNDVIVHELPSSHRILQEGDIISLDFGIKYQGLFTDMAITVPVGNINEEAKRLMMVTRKALKRAIKKTRPGNTVGDIGNTIQRYVEKQGFYIIRELCGHGIGKDLHEEPQVLNYGKRHKGVKLRAGMVICIEPMVAIGTSQIKKTKDGYGFATKDGSLSAHFEHMIAVTKTGHRVLTELGNPND